MGRIFLRFAIVQIIVQPEKYFCDLTSNTVASSYESIVDWEEK